MPNSRIRPMVVVPESSRRIQLSDDWHDHYGGSRHSREYWHARRAFLASYHFSEDKRGFKDKLMRSFKGVASEVRRQVCRRGMGMRTFRIRLGLPSAVACFAPWLNNTNW